MSLTRQDIEVLLAAVKAWETEPHYKKAIAMAMGTQMLGDNIEGHEGELSKAIDEEISKDGDREERSVLLRAKLISVKDSMAANELFDAASNAVKREGEQ